MMKAQYSGIPPSCSGFPLVQKLYLIPESCSIILGDSETPLVGGDGWELDMELFKTHNQDLPLSGTLEIKWIRQLIALPVRTNVR